MLEDHRSPSLINFHLPSSPWGKIRWSLARTHTITGSFMFTTAFAHLLLGSFFLIWLLVEVFFPVIRYHRNSLTFLLP